MTSETFDSLDGDDDTSLSMDEFRTCPEEAGLTLDDTQRAAFEQAFTDADADQNGMLLFAEIESFGETDTAEAPAAGEATAAPQGTVTVSQPGSEVIVTQPAAEVDVTQPAPQVAVETQEPQVDVTTPEPEVAVTQPEPEVSVTQAEPTVDVTQPEPEVNVAQPDAEVSVAAGQPAVDVQQVAPDVNVSQPEPEVAVTQPELDVNVDQGEADVAVEQAQPDVDVARVPGDVGVADAPATGATAEAFQINVDELDGADVLNTAGEDVGDVSNVLLDPTTNAPVLILSVGGLLGIGDREVAFPYDDFTVTGSEVVLNSDLSADQIEEMPEYDDEAYEPLPDTMRLQ